MAGTNAVGYGGGPVAAPREDQSPEDDGSTLRDVERGPRGGLRARREQLGVVVCWSRDEPHRLGEVALLDGEQILGRGQARAGDGAPRVAFHRQRPRAFTPTEPLGNPRISRVQLRLRALAGGAGGVHVESAGQCPLLLNGRRVAAGLAHPGDTIQLEDELVLVVVRRSGELPEPPLATPDDAFAFGGADRHGFVGESPAAWRLRDAIAFVASSDEHVLICGESGTGKELAARAIHELSARGARPLVSRNAATIPDGLVDAELFGNVKNYPNPGTPEREGLVGQADGSTLFLDEIGELPAHLQAHLLRVLDRGGEYSRLGEPRPRRSSLRLVAATNRPIQALKHDFAARLTLRIQVPPLSERREDIPLLVQHLLREIAAASEPVARRFFAPAEGGPGPARVEGALIDALVRRGYRSHTRELKGLLWQAISGSAGDRLSLPEGLGAEPAPELPPPAPSTLKSRQEILASLARHAGNVTLAARDLGFKNRYALYRDMKKLGMSRDAEGTGEREPG
jgi:two-component system nitrogen regulation response regulator GlnG/two-component system response regulator HydG